jgi:hypothetical protein
VRRCKCGSVDFAIYLKDGEWGTWCVNCGAAAEDHKPDWLSGVYVLGILILAAVGLGLILLVVVR